MKTLSKTAVSFAILLPLCFIIRYLQYSTVIKPENGFFILDGGFLSMAYYVAFAVSMVLFAVLAIFDRKTNCGATRGGVKRLTSGSASFGGIILAATGFLYAYEGVILFLSGNLFQTALLVGVALCYIGIGVVIFSKKRLLPWCAMLFILLAGFHVFSAGSEFMTRIYIANLSARLIILIIHLGLAAFFLSCGRAFLRAQTKRSPIFMLIYGYSACLLVFSDGLARVAYAFTADVSVRDVLLNPNVENGFLKPELYFFIQGLAVLWLIYALSAKKTKKSKNSNKNNKRGAYSEIDEVFTPVAERERTYKDIFDEFPYEEDDDEKTFDEFPDDSYEEQD
ncbi:MAG: hypothetical protein FWD34_02715 [Oscillospiraceae bacterium]|nr:hypothetical protein [Oscillospiraceae bacterium]